MRNVVFAAPFPLETTMRFARAVAGLDHVRLLGVMQEMPHDDDAKFFGDLVVVRDGLDTRQLLEACTLLQQRHGQIHRLVGVLEVLQVQLAQVRQSLGIEGATPNVADLFRDKARMKDELRKNGLPCARHALIRSLTDAETFATAVGFPLVLKPPAGMGCKSTSRVSSSEQLHAMVSAGRPGADDPMLAEEFLQGHEHSFETVTVGGKVRFSSISRYYPTPLEVMETPWIQWVVIMPKDVSGPDFADARELGERAIAALGIEDGFTHMEWFRRRDGSLAIGEIAARPPGANMVRMNSLAHDADMYRAWARAVVDEAFDGPFERRYAVGCAYLRGWGRGRVQHVTGIEQANAKVGHLVVESRLPTLGAPRSDSYEGDGYVIVRDEDTDVVKAAMKTVIETIQVRYA